VGSSFHRQGAAYLKELFVIFKEEWVGETVEDYSTVSCSSQVYNER